MAFKGVVVLGEALRQKKCPCAGGDVSALADVANRPIAHHVLDGLRAVSVEQIVVAGTADVLIQAQACLRRYSPRLSLDYAVCGEGFDFVQALRVAAPFVGSSPCIVHVADGLLGENLAPYARSVSDGSADLMVLATRTPLANGGPSCHPESRHEDLRRAGIGLFGSGAFMQLSEMEPSAGPSGFGLVVDHIRHQGGRVDIRRADGWRRYCGRPEELLDLNRLALDGLRPQPSRLTGSSNQIEGRVQIHSTACVSTAVIIGPAVVAAGATITDSYIGPYTSIGAGARIEGAEIERSIISTGAKVMHVGGRLVSSLVGPHARVFKEFSVPRAMRLRVSAGDEVALC